MVRLILILCFLATLAEAGGVSSRRQRHLNPRHAGATLVYDARYITGLNDGDAVSTWTDRGTAGNDLTQSSTQRPLYKTNIVAGQPVVRFDGSNDVMNSTSTITSPATFTIMAVWKASNGGMVYTRGSIFSDFGVIQVLATLNASIWCNGNGSYTTNASGKNISSNWGADSTWRVTSHICNATHASHSISLNGTTPTLVDYSTYTNNPSTGGSLSFRVGASSSAGGNPLNGDAAAVVYMPVYASTSLIKRVQDSLGRSFKISQQ